MKKKTRQIETTVELSETVVVRGSAASWRLCRECEPATVALMANPEDAALLAGIPTRVIYRRLESGSIHSFETSDGSVFVCLRSLLDVR
jgi:hypothetical protein